MAQQARLDQQKRIVEVDRVKLISILKDNNEKHIKEYGHTELLETLTYMQWRIWQTVRELNAAKDNGGVASN